MIYIGADHRGVELKTKLVEYMKGRGYEVEDLGTNSTDSVDYPLIANKVAKRVVEDLNNRGILLCGSGAGVCIAANKIHGARAATAWIPEIAKNSRRDDSINIVCIAADFTDQKTSEQIVQDFFDTSFGMEPKYHRRQEQIEQIEQGKL